MNVDSQDVFVLRERRAVLVRLASFEWDFSIGLPVQLQGNGSAINTRQIGTGNHEGRATIMLSPLAEWDLAEETLRVILAGGVVKVTIATGA